jgi:hypothetical protein
VHNSTGKTKLYRGVSDGHPAAADAAQGTARPRGGHSNPDKHNDGDTESIFTSWTTDESVATTHADKYRGEGGTVLSKEIPNDRLVRSPDNHTESEVLVVGDVTGADTRRVPSSD